MTAFLDQIAAMVAHVDTQWAAAGAPLPLIRPNDDAEDLDLSNGFVFIRPNISGTDFVSINGNNPRVRTFGVLEINIHTLTNTGIGQGLTYAAQFAGFIRGQFISSEIEMFAPTVDSGQEVSYNKQGRYWLTPVTCGFRFDENYAIG